MADYPGTLPDFVALVPNPQSHAQAVDVAEELQAVVDTLGTNPQAGYGTVDARLDALEATLVVAANTGYRNLLVRNNTATPTTKLDVTADVLACEGALLTTVSVTIDLTVTGKNGMTATRAVSTRYYVWIGQNPTSGEVCGILDDAHGRSLIDVSHASLTGFTKWRRVGSRRTNATGSGELHRATQQDDVLLYESWPDISSGVTATEDAWATRTISSAVPPTSRQAFVAVQWVNASLVAQMIVSEVGVDSGRAIAAGVATLGHTWVTLDSSQAFRWRARVEDANNVIWWTAGYRDAI